MTSDICFFFSFFGRAEMSRDCQLEVFWKATREFSKNKAQSNISLCVKILESFSQKLKKKIEEQKGIGYKEEQSMG